MLDHRKGKRTPEKNIYFHFTDYAKAFELCGSQQIVILSKLETSLRDKNTRPLYLPPVKSVCKSEATVKTGYGITNCFQTGKGRYQGCTLSPCLFNLYAEYIMWNARLDESQAGIKTARRNINNLRYADDTTLMAKSKKDLKKKKGTWGRWKRKVKKLA